MLTRPSDRPRSPTQWQDYLREHPFGQVIALGTGRVPVVAPSHFVLASPQEILMHFARPNPILARLREDPQVMLTVVGDYVYVPSDWNAGEEASPEYGVPTSYYTAIQCHGRAELVEEPYALAALLQHQLAFFQPDVDRRPVTGTGTPDAPQLKAIVGVRIRITEVVAKFKYGANRPEEHRRAVAQRLAERDGPMDREARAHLLATLDGPA